MTIRFIRLFFLYLVFSRFNNNYENTCTGVLFGKLLHDLIHIDFNHDIQHNIIMCVLFLFRM